MKLTQDQAKQVLKHIRNHIGYTAKQRSLPQLDKFEITGNGHTASYFNRTADSYIGTKELSLNDPNSPINNYTFMKAYISLLHEATHIYHRYETLKNNPDNSAKFISLGYLAESCSADYYTKNYIIMPQEIAAQYSAVKNGYDILCKFTSTEDANRMICNYINKHIQDGPEFIHYRNNQEYQSVDDILDAYDEAFKLARLKTRTVDIDDYKQSLKAEKPDYNEYDCMAKAIIDGKTEMLEEIQKASHGYQQDFLLAKLYLSYEDTDGYYQHNMKALSMINFENKALSIKKNPGQIRPVSTRRITPDFADLSYDEINNIETILNDNSNIDSFGKV